LKTRTTRDGRNPDITLRELRDLAEKKLPPGERELGPAQFIYIQLGRLGLTTRLHVQARESVAGDDVLLDVDEEGRIFGIEIGIAATNL
jgi:uncharacterized protein YuzE